MKTSRIQDESIPRRDLGFTLPEVFVSVVLVVLIVGGILFTFINIQKTQHRTALDMEVSHEAGKIMQKLVYGVRSDGLRDADSNSVALTPAWPNPLQDWEIVYTANTATIRFWYDSANQVILYSNVFGVGTVGTNVTKALVVTNRGGAMLEVVVGRVDGQFESEALMRSFVKFTEFGSVVWTN